MNVLIVDDDETFRGVLGNELKRLGFHVSAAASGAEALARMGESEHGLVLLDLRLPDADGLDVLRCLKDKHPAADVIMLTGHGSIDTAIESIRLGAFDYVAKPCPIGELEVRLQRAIERQALRRRATLLERALTPADPARNFVGQSAPFRSLLQLLERAAPTGSTVLVTGETGSGKEVVAKLLHARSPRRDRPFVTVECAALQESLLQSELFGHERGAFTGADRAKPGLFEVAHGGTMFLDEIGEISPATQVKLLRVLDTGTFRRVGGTTEIHVDVRIVAATNRDLEAMVQQHLFREDLYYRLRTITLRVPPLRERDGDLQLLANHFVTVLNERFGTQKRLPPDTLRALERHRWAGNVRELLHAVEAAMIVCDGADLRPEHFPALARPPHAEGAAGTAATMTLEELERSHIEHVLHETGGHRGQAARALGISERNLYRKLREYGLL